MVTDTKTEGKRCVKQVKVTYVILYLQIVLLLRHCAKHLVARNQMYFTCKVNSKLH